MEQRPFDIDPLTGAVETFYFDHSGDTFTIERREDVEPLLETAKFLQNTNDSGWKGDLHHVASIPLTILPELEKLGIMDCAGRVLDEKKFRQWINARENRAFRTKLGDI
jgi:hypothetical protein